MSRRRKHMRHVKEGWGVVWEGDEFDPGYATEQDADDAVYYARYKRKPMLSGRVVRVRITELPARRAQKRGAK